MDDIEIQNKESEIILSKAPLGKSKAPKEPKEKLKLKRALNVAEIAAKEYTFVEGLDSYWYEVLGAKIEDSFVMLAYGESGQGKSSFIYQLLYAFRQYNALYVSCEEAFGYTVQEKANRLELHKNMPNLQYIDGESFEHLYERLDRKKSPKIVIIDSWQYTRYTEEEYKKLKKRFVQGKTPGKRKIFFIVSHKQGKEPRGPSAFFIKYDSDIKVLVQGLVAFIDSRFINVKHHVINESLAKAYWGDQFNKVINKSGKIPSRRNKKEKPKKQKEVKSEPANNDNN